MYPHYIYICVCVSIRTCAWIGHEIRYSVWEYILTLHIKRNVIWSFVLTSASEIEFSFSVLLLRLRNFSYYLLHENHLWSSCCVLLLWWWRGNHRKTHTYTLAFSHLQNYYYRSTCSTIKCIKIFSLGNVSVLSSNRMNK